MTKKILIKIGKLKELQWKLHNDFVDSGYSDELLQKCDLVKKVAKQLEEQKRGFLKSNLPYTQMADYLIANANLLPYSELHKGIMKIVFNIKGAT